MIAIMTPSELSSLLFPLVASPFWSTLNSLHWRSCGLSLFIWSLWPFCLNYSWSARLERLKVLLVTTCLPWAATVLSTFSTGFTVTTLRDFSILLLLSQDVCRLYSTVTSSIFILQKFYEAKRLLYQHERRGCKICLRHEKAASLLLLLLLVLLLLSLMGWKDLFVMGLMAGFHLKCHHRCCRRQW